MKGACCLLLKSVSQSSSRGIDSLFCASCADHSSASNWPLVWNSGVQALMVEWPSSTCKECGYGYKFTGMEVSAVHSHHTPPGSLLHQLLYSFNYIGHTSMRGKHNATTETSVGPPKRTRGSGNQGNWMDVMFNRLTH